MPYVRLGSFNSRSMTLTSVASNFEKLCTRSSRCPPSQRWFWLDNTCDVDFRQITTSLRWRTKKCRFSIGNEKGCKRSTRLVSVTPFISPHRKNGTFFFKVRFTTGQSHGMTVKKLSYGFFGSPMAPAGAIMAPSAPPKVL